MILPPVTPVMPIDPTRVYELVSANTEAVKAVLFLLGFIVFAVVSSVLTVRYLAKAKTGLYSEIGGSIAMSVAVLLFIRYGASLVALQGLLLYDLLLYASVSDIRTRKAEDWAWIAMIPLALCSIPRIGILSMLLGAGIVFLPQLAMAVLPPHKTLGGADIGFSARRGSRCGRIPCRTSCLGHFYADLQQSKRQKQQELLSPDPVSCGRCDGSILYISRHSACGSLSL